MKDPEEIALCLINLQTRLSHELQWFAIPLAAKGLRKFVYMAILQASKPFSITAAMLKQRIRPVGLQTRTIS